MSDSGVTKEHNALVRSKGERVTKPQARGPSQERSRASLDRMLATARALMIERQDENFTLQEVSVRGKVSIGSIYFRFRNKDDLVLAVIAQDMEQMAEREVTSFATLQHSITSLAEYVPALVRMMAQNLSDHALMLRLAMKKAAIDRAAAPAGDQREHQAVQRVIDSLSHYRSEISGDLEIKGKVVFNILFSTIVRHLSLVSEGSAARTIELDALIDELSQVVLAYITAPPAR